VTQGDLSARLVALLTELNPEAVLWDNLDAAIIGIGLRDTVPVAIYDYNLMVLLFMEQESWTQEDAVEWIEYNVIGAYVGTGTPMVANVDDPWGDVGDDDDDGIDGYGPAVGDA
jgi:hypothetical protein